MTPLLEARAVSAGYGGGEVVHELSFALHAGETLAVVGPNAAGKSTLLHALVGSLPLHAGEVLLSGRPIGSLPSRERARQLAVVPQSARFDLDFTVREMVAFGRAPHAGAWGLESSKDVAAIERALDDSDLRPLSSRPFAELSGGERQRVLIARAFAQGAPLLLFDEPTAHLDLGHQLLVVEHVQEHASRGGAALVILHELSLAARLSRVAVLDQGKLVALGSPVEVLTRARLAATWGIDGELRVDEEGPALIVRGRA